MSSTKQVPLPPALARLITHHMDRVRLLQREADDLRSDITMTIDEHCRLSGLDHTKVQYDPSTQMLLIAGDTPSQQDPALDHTQHDTEGSVGV